jgi:adhesin transport system membrane fusion protein
MSLFWMFQAPRGMQSGSEAELQGLKGPRLTLWLTAVLLAAFLAWSYFSEIDQVARAQGAVIPSSSVKIIQTKDGGVLKPLPVRAGDLVARGDVLAEFDETEARAEVREGRAKLASLTATVARLRSELFGERPSFDFGEYETLVRSQALLLERRQGSHRDQLAAIDTLLALVREEIAINEPLIELGDVSRAEILRLQRQEAELVAERTNTVNDYFQDAQAQLAEAEEELERTRQLLVQREQQLTRTVIRSPVRGLIKSIQTTTEGGVIRPGDDVMEIVPVDDDLIIEAKLSPADRGFVALGDSASVKIDAYDYTIYGDLQGEVTYISADTIEEDTAQGPQKAYLIKVRTFGRSFSGRPEEQLEIVPGMTSMVEVKLGRHSIFSFLIKPIAKTLQESLGEK